MRPPTVVLYELNEVPWEIVDLYLGARPASNIGRLVEKGETYTTVNDDTAGLSPWRTWPTLHKSLYTHDHNSFDLGQDPETFRGTDVWNVLDRAGYSIGLFGPLQSWPAQEFRSGGFHVPDTFARDASTVPGRLEPFQMFNLKMTSENGFSSDAPLSPAAIGRVAFSLIRNGLSPRSVVLLLRHIVRERMDSRYKAGRSMMQVVPSFDLFWRLFTSAQPGFSIFFTNHVASMMHRYWGDAVPGYSGEYDYTVDDVYSTFVLDAMDLADAQLGKLMKWVEERENSRLVIAASMGQGPVQYRQEISSLLVLRDGSALGRHLDCGPVGVGLAMHPMCSLEFDSEDLSSEAQRRLGRIETSSGGAMFEEIERHGRTVTFRTSYSPPDGSDSPTASIDGRSVSYGDLGVDVRERLGGDNTAYHIPEGMLIDYAPRAAHGPSGDRRDKIDVLDVAPSLLRNTFDLDVPEEMNGTPRAGLFGG